jgi:hypothetical protein
MHSRKTNKMQLYTMVFITIDTPHVSGSYSTPHQELKIVYIASGVCRAFYATYCYQRKDKGINGSDKKAKKT